MCSSGRRLEETFSMEFEITIEGPARAVYKIHEKLKSFIRSSERTDYHDALGGKMARIVILEGDEELLDRRLVTISSQIADFCGDAAPKEDIRVRVRNLAYSEPYTGSGEFAEPFEPIPFLTVQPWKPGLAEPDDPQTIVLDCPHAFGTGKHPTTLLCLRFLAQMAGMETRGGGLRGLRVLDFGCGTGILALAAAKMGCARALGVEIDPDAAKAAKRNVTLNHLDGIVEIREGSWEAAPGRFDLVLANVVAGVLFKVGRDIPAYLKPGGRAVVSGFGEKQDGEIRRLFEDSGLIVYEKASEGDWCALLLKDGRLHKNG